MANCHFCNADVPLMTSKTGESINWYVWNNEVFAYCISCFKKTMLDIEKLGAYGNSEQKKAYNTIVNKMVYDNSVKFIGDKKQNVLITNVR